MTLAMATADGTTQIDAKPIDAFQAWHTNEEGQPALWPGYLRLTDKFFESLMEHAVPLQPEAIGQLQNSAFALDVYSWLAHRLCRVNDRNGVDAVLGGAQGSVRPGVRRHQELQAQVPGRAAEGDRRLQGSAHRSGDRRTEAAPLPASGETEDGGCYGKSACRGAIASPIRHWSADHAGLGLGKSVAAGARDGAWLGQACARRNVCGVCEQRAWRRAPAQPRCRVPRLGEEIHQGQAGLSSFGRWGVSAAPSIADATGAW